MDEQEKIREVMSLMGRRTSEKKAAAVRENAVKARAAAQTDEARAKMRASQQARRLREAAKTDLPNDTTPG